MHSDSAAAGRDSIGTPSSPPRWGPSRPLSRRRDSTRSRGSTPANRDRVHSMQSNHSRRSLRSFIGETPSMIGVPERGERGVASVAIVLYKTITGAGALAMPYAFWKSGKILFPLMVLFVTLCSHYGCLLLARALDMTRRGDLDYAELGRLCMGRWGFYFAMFVCFFDSWGAAIAAFRMIAELILPVLEDHNVLGPYSTPSPGDGNMSTPEDDATNTTIYSYGFIIAIVAIAIYPALLYKKVTELGFISFLGVVAMLVFVVTLFVKCVSDPHSLDGLDSFSWNADAVVAIPIIAFSYDCQSNVFGSYRDISGVVGDKSDKLVAASAWANLSAAASYIAIAFTGYIAFTTDVQQDILESFASSNLLDAVKIFFALSVMLSFPVILIECSTIVREHLVVPGVISLMAAAGWDTCCGAELDGDMDDPSIASAENTPHNADRLERKALLGKEATHVNDLTHSTLDEQTLEVPALPEGWLNTAVGAVTSLCILGSAAVVAAAVPSMYSAFTYVGATTATLNTAVLPPLFYLMTVRRLFPQFSIFQGPDSRTSLEGVEVKGSEGDALFPGANPEDFAGPGNDDDDGPVDLICAPPPAYKQWLALIYLLCGVVAIPTLLYVVATAPST
eukprot:TRINITY_DN5445_c2_g1_i1.p1 TRINITY_DN5445_c2_g1~~TRINITY_DN5445_c2_g1_i1.p1  ORF type:complete len:695 (+),score=203.10 TRINITY_DN5445_c2_g1_i1:223-2085(+)